MSGNLSSTLTDFSKISKQRVVLSGQLFSGSNPWSIVIFDLYKQSPRRLTTNTRLFADDISLFSVADNVNLSATNLNSYLSKINTWASEGSGQLLSTLIPTNKRKRVFFS